MLDARPTALSSATVRLPESVVFRPLAAQTVMLDLRTGIYHGLDPRAGELLPALVAAGSPARAAERLAGATGASAEALEAELCELCLALDGRGLLEITLETQE